MARVIQTADLDRHSTPLSPNASYWVYNGLDCAVTLEVLHAIHPQLDNVSHSTYSFSKDLQAPVLEMSMRGLRVDQSRRDKVLSDIRRDILRLEGQLDRIIREGVGTEINWRSPSQLSSLFYDVMGLPEIKKRSANGFMVRTADRDAIERLELYFTAEPICRHLLTLRDLDKKRQFLETSIDSDGRMRTNLNIAGTNTGRFSSAMSDFGTGRNLQNIEAALRSVFVADPGMKFANLDLEQADARNVGAICWNHFVLLHGEAFAGAYLDACESGDLHTRVCRMAWNDLEWGTEETGFRRVADRIAYRDFSYRFLAKKLGHGTNYYGLPPTMAKHTKVDRLLIEDFQRKYFAAFPAIGSYDRADRKADHWHNRVRNQLREFPVITTLLGRRRYFYGRPDDADTLREAIAYEPQSMTADEINQGLLNIWRAQKVQCLLQVHDSILIQYPEEQENEIVPWAIETLRTKLELAKGRSFTVPTEAKIGWTWGDVVYDEEGNVVDNPDGLIKWKGEDKRTRQENRSLSLHAV